MFDNTNRKKGTGFTNIGRVLEANKGSIIGQAVSQGLGQKVQGVQGGFGQAQQGFKDKLDEQQSKLDETKLAQGQALGRFEASSGNSKAALSSGNKQETGPRGIPGGNRAGRDQYDLSNYTLKDLENIKNQGLIYQNQLSDLGDTNYQKLVEEHRSRFYPSNYSTPRPYYSTTPDKGLIGEWDRNMDLYMTNYEDMAKLTGSSPAVIERAKQMGLSLIDPLQKLNLQREASQFLDRYNIDAVTNRINELTAPRTADAAALFDGQDNFNNILSLVNRGYSGPQKMELDSDLLFKAREAQQLGNLTSDTFGRQELLKRFVGDKNYTAGQRALDEVLMGQEGNKGLRSRLGEISNLNQQLSLAEELSKAQTKALASQFDTSKQQFQGSLGNIETGLKTGLDTRLETFQLDLERKRADADKIKQILTSQDPLISSKYKNDQERLDAAVSFLEQSKILNPQDEFKLKDLIERSKMLSPFWDKNAKFQRGGIKTNDLLKAIDDSLRSSFVNPTTVQTGNLASNVELTQLAALNQLMGRTSDLGIQPGQLMTRGTLNLDKTLLDTVRQREIDLLNRNYRYFDTPALENLSHYWDRRLRGSEIREQIARSQYCFSPETEILMASGKYKKIKDIQPKEEVALGGTVEMIGQSKSDDLYQYENVKVTGDHAVFENGKWIRAKDSEKSSPIGKEGLIYTIHTENHLVVTKGIVWTDSMETEENSKDAQYSLDVLNENKPRNKKLERFIQEYFDKDSKAFKEIKTPF